MAGQFLSLGFELGYLLRKSYFGFEICEELFGFSSEDWEAALDLMLETMSEAIADGILPDAIEYVAVGFVDGDLEEVFCRE